MEEEQVKKKKKTLIVTIVTMVLLVLIVGVSYAFWQLTKVQEDANIISSGCFGVTLEGNEAINLSSQYPIKTEEGMNTTPYTFTITNTCSGSANYIVNLESLSETTFQNSSIRVALNDTNKLYSEYRESSKYYSDSIEARTLISGTLENNGSVTYNLRMWIDESAPATEQNKIFASKIVVLSGEEGELIDPLIENLETTNTLESINITYQANGDVVPVVCKYGIEEGNYTNTVTSATTSNCKITGLTPNTTYYYQVCTTTGKGEACKDGSASTENISIPLSVAASVGDYIKMTPTSTSYTISKDLTGHNEDQTINPSELNLWRIIKIKEDGTIEMISDSISYTAIRFVGERAYMNAVGLLNMISSSYRNDKYVVNTRIVGYKDQVENCEEFSEESCPSDTGYEEDLELINIAYKGDPKCEKNCESLKAYKAGTKIRGSYWLGSRLWSASSSSLLHTVTWEGSRGNTWVWRPDVEYIVGCFIRPVVTLRADVQIASGDGRSAETAYTLE